MIGIKNSNSLFRFSVVVILLLSTIIVDNYKNKDMFSVVVILLLSTIGLIRMRAQSYDIVASYSETFYTFYGFSPYQYYFSDSKARRLTINFYEIPMR